MVYYRWGYSIDSLCGAWGLIMDVDVELNKCKVSFSEGYDSKPDSVRIKPDSHSDISQLTVRIYKNGDIKIARWDILQRETIIYSEVNRNGG